MANDVYFHIGLPKAGTTFVQTTMWRNRDRLKAQGFLYPGKDRMQHYHASQEVCERQVRQEASVGSWQRIVDELAAWNGTGLVSHEFFSMAKAPQASRAIRALAPATVHVVVTARDYQRQFPAMWQESVKMGSTVSFDEFMSKALARKMGSGAWTWRSQDLPRVLARWSRIVPEARVHVVTLPPPGAPRDLLWQRWRETLGFDDSGFDLDSHFSNESLGAAELALLQRVTPQLQPPLDDLAARHRWLRQYFGHEVLGPLKGDPIALRPDVAEALAALSAEAARTIRAAGYSVTGDLDDLVPPGTPGAGRHPDDVSEAELLDVATRAIETMIRDVQELTTRRRDHASVRRYARGLAGWLRGARDRRRR